MIAVYHRCNEYATGSVGSAIFWWAQLDAGAWRFRFAGLHDLSLRPSLQREIAMAARLDVTPATAAAAAQDARAEAPDL